MKQKKVKDWPNPAIKVRKRKYEINDCGFSTTYCPIHKVDGYLMCCEIGSVYCLTCPNFYAINNKEQFVLCKKV
jgi:hypothetical protein